MPTSISDYDIFRAEQVKERGIGSPGRRQQPGSSDPATACLFQSRRLAFISSRSLVVIDDMALSSLAVSAMGSMAPAADERLVPQLRPPGPYMRGFAKASGDVRLSTAS